MYTQEVVLQELIASGSPYAVEFHRILAKRHKTSVTKIGAVAQRFSLAIDAALSREREAKENQPQKPRIPAKPAWKQAEARAILAQAKAEKQAIKENEDLAVAASMVDLLTPEFLQSLVSHPKSAFANSK